MPKVPDEMQRENDPTPEEQPFDYGDRTILSLRTQAFQVEQPEEEFGTMMSLPAAPVPTHTVATPLPEPDPVAPLAAAPTPTPAAAAAPVVDDPIARLEQKLDLALRQIERLQHRLESIDSTLAMTLNR